MSDVSEANRPEHPLIFHSDELYVFLLLLLILKVLAMMNVLISSPLESSSVR